MEESVKRTKPVKKRKAEQYADPEAVKRAADDYFENSGVYSIPGLCVALDITKDTLFLWEAGFADRESFLKGKGFDAELSGVVKKALLKIERYLLESDGKNRAAKDMAVLKRYYGYGDRVSDGGGGNIDLGAFDEYSV